MDGFLHDLRQPGRMRQILGGETYYRYQPDGKGNCLCPNCVKAREYREQLCKESQTNNEATP